MNSNKKRSFLYSTLILFAMVGLIALFMTCGGSSDSMPTPGGTVTISGTLTTASANISKNGAIYKADAAGSYKILVLDMTTGEQKTTTAAADGTFSLTATGNSDYSINILDSNNKFVGTLMTSTPADNKVSVALTTGEDGSATDLGTITANSTTGQVESDATIESTTSHFAYANNDGIVAGANTGDGTTDYTATVGATACTTNTATCPDFDRDGVPDIFDSDNNNDGYSDEVSGLYDYCVPGDVKLYVTNYPAACSSPMVAAQPSFPTPAEVDAYLGLCTKYIINMEFTPKSGTTTADISDITMSTPAYVTQYGYLNGVITASHSCFNTLWNTCNGQKLILSDDGTLYHIGVSRNGNETGDDYMLKNMNTGDTYIFNITMADGTTHVCSRKINIIPKYFVYYFKKDNELINTGSTQTNLTFPFTLSWTIPTQNPTGMTYSIYIYPFNSCSDTYDSMTPTIISAGQDGTSKIITAADMPSSAKNLWAIDIYQTTPNGDNAHESPVRFTTAASDPCY